MSQSIIVFTRYPKAGKAKTRLIPSMGAEGAAELQRQMTQHTVGRAWAYAVSCPNTRLIVAFEGGSTKEMRDWLGPLEYRSQGKGDLGARLSRAIDHEFKMGAKKVIVVGSDCPSINEDIFERSFVALNETTSVFGPAQDGGYYLVGMNHPQPHLFHDIPWGTDRVLASSLLRIRNRHIEPRLLPLLQDVDEFPDIAVALHQLQRGRSLSVIIPTLNESASLINLIPRLQAANPLEIIVADGGSSDATVQIANSLGVRVITSERGRGRQMNAAAKIALGEHLLFIHADTDPPENFVDVIANTLATIGTVAGAFSFALREPVALKSVIEKLVHLRCRLLNSPYGDQGLFIRRYIFEHLGGYPDWPILEDVQIVRQLKKIGRVSIVTDACATSSRRWQKRGTIATFLRHQLILVGYWLGIPASSLVAFRR